MSESESFFINTPFADAANPLNDNLISYWKLDETSGTRVDSQSTNDLTDNNTVGNAAGIIGNAALFVAANSEYLSHTDNAELSTGNIDFTVNLWVYRTGTAKLGVAGKWGGNPLKEWYIETQVESSGTSTVSFRWATNGSGGFTQLDSGAGISASAWHMITCWHDSTSNDIHMVIDDGTPETPLAASGGNDGAGEFRIGNYPAGSFFEGRIDEVGIWKRILTASEITELYNSGAAKTCCPFI